MKTFWLALAVVLAAVLVGIAGCSDEPGGGDNGAVDAGADGAGASEFVAQPADFPCLADDTKVGLFYIRNPLGKAQQDEAIAIAKANEKGKEYPIGTIIRLIPREAMVKRGGAMSETGGWEYINLAEEVTGTVTIKARGGKEITNQAGSCHDCHTKAKDHDFICKKTNGCGTLEQFGVTDAVIAGIQGSDSLCKK